jgi:hypothetical protein
MKPVLDADRSNLELAFIELQDDPVVIVSLGVDDPSRMIPRALRQDKSARLSGDAVRRSSRSY